MRIVGGTWKGRHIKVPKKGIRPTKGIVRGAIFDVIGYKIANAEVLDIYAGSGALGLEAISRGAKSCTFVEKLPRNLYHNIKIFSPRQSIVVLSCDFRPALKKLKDQKFDIIFADPPYGKRYANKTLMLIEYYSLLRNEGFVVLEHATSDELEPTDSLALLKSKKYGDTQVSFLRHRKH
jgi:16S rRNA (guanine966-N2)-methyltransferase